MPTRKSSRKGSFFATIFRELHNDESLVAATPRQDQNTGSLAPLESPEKVTEMLARELDPTIRVYDTE
jgi:hypothetical protein